MAVVPSDLPPPPAETARLGKLFERSDAVFSRKLRLFASARAAVFTGTGALVVFVLLRAQPQPRFGYSIKFVLSVVVLAWVSAILQWWVSRLGRHMQSVAMTLLLVDQALFSSIVYLTGGVSSGATSLLGVTCVVGGVLLGIQGAIASVVAGITFFSLILLIVEGARELLPPDQPGNLYALGPSQAVYYYVFTVFMLLLVGLLSGYLADRLARAGGEVVAARERAKRAERMAVLGRLAAGLAHEIRNPLSAISGAVQMLRVGSERDEDRELCDIVIRESARLDDLVSDMLLLSKSREKKLQPVDLGRLVYDVVQLASRSGRSAADVRVRHEADSGAWVMADEAQIRQLAWNLIRNAVQASASGGEVRVRVLLGDSVRLVVEDDGVGIDPSAQGLMFDEFFTTRTHGTGLGLAVVKRIADEHGIVLKVESERDHGAIFSADFGPVILTP